MRWWPLGRTTATPFAFRDEPLAVRADGDLELVEPSAAWVEPMLVAAAHPACAHEPIGRLTRGELLRFVERFPRGREPANPMRGRVPSYTFWMRLRSPSLTIPEMAGTISLRIGDTEDLRRYLGHIGYGVHPPARGRHLSERACRLVLPLARSHGLHEVWITANPDNYPSRRTCERLGATLVDTVDLPFGHPLYLRGDRQKCRYRLALD